MNYYRLKDETILDYAKFKYDDNCLQTEKNIVRDFNGKLIFEEETQTTKYQEQLNSYNNKLNLQKELIELENWFNEFFEKQLIQSTWQSNFKVSEDTYFKDENGEFKTYSNIEELKEQGEFVRIKIKELRKTLSIN